MVPATPPGGVSMHSQHGALASAYAIVLSALLHMREQRTALKLQCGDRVPRAQRPNAACADEQGHPFFTEILCNHEGLTFPARGDEALG